MSVLKSKRDEIVFRMKLVSKDEFEILSRRVENLEKKIDQLKSSKIKKIKKVKKS
jgi:tetrahydromethanopterin S-methyltransferase subunit G